MITAYPSGVFDHLVLLLSVAIVSGGISVLLPLKWGWRAFPVVVAGTGAVLVIGLISAVYFPYEQGQGMVMHFSSMLIIWYLLVIALVFAATLSVRTTRRSGQ